MQFDLTCRLAAVRIVESAVQVGVGQHVAAVVAQAYAGIIQARGSCAAAHVHQRIVRLVGGMHRRCSVGHARHRHRHRRVRTAFSRCMRAVPRVVPCRPSSAQRPRQVERRHGRFQSVPHRQGAAGVAGATHVLRNQGEGILAARLDQDIVGFRRCNAELLDVTGCTYWPSAATTVNFRPGMRTSK